MFIILDRWRCCWGKWTKEQGSGIAKNGTTKTLRSRSGYGLVFAFWCRSGKPYSGWATGCPLYLGRSVVEKEKRKH